MSAVAERPDIAAMLRFWQPVMRLADWEIVARYKRRLSASGYCYPDFPYKRARIEICDPRDWNEEAYGRKQDVEADLLHELGHCHFAPFRTQNATPLGDAEEQIVTAYARALLDVHRRQRAA